MVSASLLSLQSGRGNNFICWLRNYARLFQDEMFTSGQCITYLRSKCPSCSWRPSFSPPLLNHPAEGQSIFRTFIFLPCSPVSSARRRSSNPSFHRRTCQQCVDGIGYLKSPLSWLTHPVGRNSSLFDHYLAVDRYNTVFTSPACRRSIADLRVCPDGASSSRQFFTITIPLLKPVILLTTIMSTNGTLQASMSATLPTGAGIATLSISQYIYNFRLSITRSSGMQRQSAIIRDGGHPLLHPIKAGGKR